MFFKPILSVYLFYFISYIMYFNEFDSIYTFTNTFNDK